jgi:hypothetical protein
MRLPIALTAVLAVLAVPAGASGAVTIGSNLSATSTTNGPGGCYSVCTGVNLNLPATSTAANGLTSPINGVVVKWRVKTGSTGNNPISLRVLRPAGGTSFTGVGTSSTGSLSATTVNATTGIGEFATRLKIRAGDSVGLNPGNSALVWTDNPGATSVYWSITQGSQFTNGLGDGQTAPGASTSSPQELLVQAVVEPDADGDGFGDETQDGCPADPTRQTPPCSTGPTNPNGNPPPTTTSVAPVVSAQAVVPASFRLGSLARIRFRLSEAAKYNLLFDRILPGRKRGKRCVLQSRLVRTGPRCSVYVRRASILGTGQAGLNTLGFRGRVAGKALPLGRYRLTIEAVAGVLSAKTKSTRFTLLPALRRR